jgi:galactose mutarotase-like enzyme
MFVVEARQDPENLETLELVDDAAESRAVLAPARGGMLTRLTLAGQQILYLDETTLRDREKNVRGGNPVLFPQPGKLEGGTFARDGKKGALLQHGFARNLPWTVARTSTAIGASATLSLGSSEATKAAYPWDFNVEYTYTLRARVLRVDMTFTNTGSEPMPFGAGFHPYFFVRQASKSVARIHTTATSAFDNVTKETGPLPEGGIDLTRSEVDLHLEDHGAVPIGLEWPHGRVELRGSPEVRRWVVWTLEGKDFVCVEPWTCPGNALNTGVDLLRVAPSETRRLWVEYESS